MRNPRTWFIVNLLVLALVLSSCAATTALGKAKEGLAYNKEVAVSLMAEAVKLHDAKKLTDQNYAKVSGAYTKYAAAHNAAVSAVEAVQRSGTGLTTAQTSLAAASGALSEFINLATAFGLVLP